MLKIIGPWINVGPEKFSKKNKQNLQTYVEKIENICSLMEEIQNLINVGPFNKAVGPGKKIQHK